MGLSRLATLRHPLSLCVSLSLSLSLCVCVCVYIYIFFCVGSGGVAIWFGHLYSADPGTHPMPQLSKLEEDIERNKFDFINLMHLAEVLQQVWGPCTCAGIGVCWHFFWNGS